MVVVLMAGVILTGAALDSTGTLFLYANGEDFVRQGLVSKDGWQITFDRVSVTLAEITAYQTNPPYDPEAGGELQAEVSAALPGEYTVDLAEGDEDAGPILIGEMADTPAGRYNALAWRMIRAAQGEDEEYSLVIEGTAEKDGETIPFTLKIEHEYEYICGDYVGDERKGILDAGGEADLEMTFHFDHIFGNGELPPDDGLNESAPGFAMFASLAEDGVTEVDMAALESVLSEEDYQMLVDILPTLGHVGEGHCLSLEDERR
jgi:hypothetical protein